MKENIGNLIRAISERTPDKEERDYLLTFVAERLSTFTGYFNSVYNDVIASETSRILRDTGRIDQEEFEFRLTRSDASRRSAHNLAIDACTQLNRLCDNFHVPKFCPETDDRHVIADFIGKFVSELYQEGQRAPSIDQAIENARKTNQNPDRAYKDLSAKEVDDWSR
ncbi:MAG: hypothetical protein K6G10_07015 [Butyrivibrio sp.]|nr:hypothetical protein [Butyrivibrio sp.]